MDPKILIGLLLAMLIAAIVYTFDEELIAFFTDSDQHVEFGESLGVTKAGKPRPTD